MKNADVKKRGSNSKDKNEANGASILDFCKKNIKIISVAVVVILLVIVLVVFSTKDDDSAEPTPGPGIEGNGEPATGQSAAFEVDAIPEINTLVENYYAALAAGDTATLETYATPVSEGEKSYITLMSQYVNAYENVHCHTKPGMTVGEYAVYVVADVRFEGAETPAPGMEFFYIRTKESGAFYIDNLYSQFNSRIEELPTDPQISAFIGQIDAQEDVKALAEDVLARCDAALASDENLSNVVNVTVPQAIQAWASNLMGTDSSGAVVSMPEDNSQEAPEETPQDTPEEAPQEETTSNAETVYALDNVNIRGTASEDGEKVGSASKGDSFTRTGMTDDGWSEIDFEGGKAYIKSEFLSTEAVAADDGDSDEVDNDVDLSGLSYVPDGTVLTATDTYNVRASMSETADLVGTVAPGDTINVIQSLAEGWTRVEWNGERGYIRTDLLLGN